MFNRFLVLFLALGIAGGCASSTREVVTYSNPRISGANKETQWLIDRGACLQKSYRIPVPTRTPCYGSGFSKGYCESEQSRLLNQVNEARQQIFDGCMAEKGYKKKITSVKK